MTEPNTGKTDGGDTGKPAEGEAPKGFTQADVDRIIDQKTSSHKAELSKLQKQITDLSDAAKKGQTAEEQIADLQNQLKSQSRDLLVRRVQASHGISDDDADLFLTGADQETLEKQAKRLKEQAEDRQNNGLRTPREGRNGRPQISDEKQAVRALFGRGS